MTRRCAIVNTFNNCAGVLDVFQGFVNPNQFFFTEVKLGKSKAMTDSMKMRTEIKLLPYRMPGVSTQLCRAWGVIRNKKLKMCSSYLEHAHNTGTTTPAFIVTTTHSGSNRCLHPNNMNVKTEIAGE